jgi:hypothetical protein
MSSENRVTAQLAKENRKFFFGQVKPGGRMRDFELAIQWLADAGLIYKVNRVSKRGLPLKFYIEFSSFKLFILDVGLLGAMGGVDVSSVLEGNTIFEEFRGGDDGTVCVAAADLGHEVHSLLFCWGKIDV